MSEIRVIAFIHDEDVIWNNLTHLNLWDVKRKPQPCAHAPPIDVFPLYDQPQAKHYYQRILPAKLIFFILTKICRCVI